jgi:hypothetical protein
MALPLRLKHRFIADIGDCKALFQHCLAPRGQHSDAGIEAAFLQMFKSWEAFQEECSIAFLAGRLRVNGTTVVCHIHTQNEEIARQILYQGRPFIEWADPDRVIERWDLFFHPPSLLAQAVRAAKVELVQMRTIRNSIAHSSPSAESKFRKMTGRGIGGDPQIPRAAVFLAMNDPEDPSRTMFDKYSDVLEATASSIAG